VIFHSERSTDENHISIYYPCGALIESRHLSHGESDRTFLFGNFVVTFNRGLRLHGSFLRNVDATKADLPLIIKAAPEFFGVRKVVPVGTCPVVIIFDYPNSTIHGNLDAWLMTNVRVVYQKEEKETSISKVTLDCTTGTIHLDPLRMPAHSLGEPPSDH
jgi:hypothetical protein